MDFKIGDRVRTKKELRRTIDTWEEGKVVGYDGSNPNLVYVEWDSKKHLISSIHVEWLIKIETNPSRRDSNDT